jgi:soluble lytic murein transglycosylase-like protein
LRELATSGHVDLPAHWAAARLGATVRPIELFDTTPPPVPAPRWASDLMNAGRTADVLVGWRAELDRQRAPAAGWLSFARLASLPPLEAIPILVRGEPRLLTGQWSGLPRGLLKAYLPLEWRVELEQAAARAGVPPWVLAALVRQESAWFQRAVSAAGAVGLTQVLPATAQELMKQRRDVFVGDKPVTDPATNLTIGALLLSQWRRAFSGSWVAAIAAYNAGERRVRSVWDRAKGRDGPEFVEALEIPETWDYVHRVVMLAEGYRVLYWPDGKGYPWT